MDKIKALLDKIEELLSNGDWPTEDAEDVESLCHQIRGDMEVA